MVLNSAPGGRLADLLAVEEEANEHLRLGGGLTTAQLQVVVYRGGLGKEDSIF